MGTVSLRNLYDKFGSDVQFVSVYIREAHPVDGWWLGGWFLGPAQRMARTRAATDVYDPETIEERREVAGRCETSLAHGIPTLVDEMDDAVNKAYAAWPTRLYLIDLEGRVVYHGGLGPVGFMPAKLGAAIEKYLAS